MRDWRLDEWRIHRKHLSPVSRSTDVKPNVVLALLVLVAAVPAVAPASSQPDPLCSVCDDGFERAATDAGLESTVTQSTVEVVVSKNGSARWTVRNRLANESTADRLRTDPDLLDRVVRTALGDGDRRPDSARVSDLSARVEGTEVVVTFAYSSFAESTVGGVLIVDYVHSGGDRESYGLGADEFTVVGPAGSVAVNDPATGQVREGEGREGVDDGGKARSSRVTWVSSDDGYGRVDRYIDDTYVAFGPSDGVVQQVGVSVAFAVRTVPTVLNNLALLLPAALVFAAGLAGLGRAGRVGLASGRPERLATGVLAVGLLAIIHPMYAGTVPLVNDDIAALSVAGTVYALVGVTALALVVRRKQAPWWWLLAPAVLVPPVAALLVALLSYAATPWDVSDVVWLGVPLATVFPLGYAAGSGTRRGRRFAVATLLGVTAALALQYVSFTQRPFAGGLLAIIAAFLVAFGLLFGTPLYLLGESVARHLDARQG
jgi:hypothetical protein